MDIIEKYHDKPWDWHSISSNNFLFNDRVYITQLKKDIKNEIKDIFYNDICGEILKYV